MTRDVSPAYEPAVVVEPGVEPVSVAEVATHSRLRIETAAELTHVELLIKAARRSVELTLRRSLITQTRRHTVHRWPREDRLYLPRGPVQAVSSVVYHPKEGDSVTWNAANYDTMVWPLEPAAVLAADTWPSEALRSQAGIEVTYTAGYGDTAADVPEMFRLAILLVIGDYIENREATVFSPVMAQRLAMPSGVAALLELDRDRWEYYEHGRG